MNKILKLFEKHNAYLKGHFQLSSGLHSNGYMQCALVLQYPKYSQKFGKAIAELYKDEKIDCVVGPAMGGVIIAFDVARALKVRSIFTERKDGKMALRRGFSINKGERILVVEDVITTGGSAAEVIELLQGMGACVVGVSSIIDRSNGAAGFTVPFKPLTKADIATYDPQVCPLCKKGLPIDKPGSRSNA